MHKENVWLDFIAQGVNIDDGTIEFYSDSKEIDIVHVRLISFETVRGINERFSERIVFLVAHARHRSFTKTEHQFSLRSTK